MSRLEDALARIAKMEAFRSRALENHSFDTPNPEFVDEKLMEIAEHGICQLRNDIGMLPINPEKYKKVLVVDGSEEKDGSAELLKEELIRRGFEAEVKRDIYDVPSRVCWQADIDKLQAEYSACVCQCKKNFF